MLHTLHRFSAVLIGSFILIHLFNHSLIFIGIQAHINFMDSLRTVYRNPLVESALLLCVLYQVGSGLYFVWSRRGQRRGFIERAQAMSGLYLAYFFLNHVGAVLYGRIVADLDTNIFYGIAGFHESPYHLYFIPYYFLAVVAIFVHLAAAFHWLSRNGLGDLVRARLAYLIMTVGVLFAASLMMGFSGLLGDIQIPPEYRAIYN